MCAKKNESISFKQFMRWLDGYKMLFDPATRAPSQAQWKEILGKLSLVKCTCGDSPIIPPTIGGGLFSDPITTMDRPHAKGAECSE